MRTPTAATWGFAIISVSCTLWHWDMHKFLFFFFPPPSCLEIEHGKSPPFSHTSLADGAEAAHLPQPAGRGAGGRLPRPRWVEEPHGDGTAPPTPSCPGQPPAHCTAPQLCFSFLCAWTPSGPTKAHSSLTRGVLASFQSDIKAMPAGSDLCTTERRPHSSLFWTIFLWEHCTFHKA